MRQYVLENRVAEPSCGKLLDHLTKASGLVVEAAKHDVLNAELCEHHRRLHRVGCERGVDDHRQRGMPSEQFTSLPQFESADGPGIENDQIHGTLADGEQQRTPAIDDREGVISREGDLQLGGEWGREAGEDFHGWRCRLS